MTSTEVVREGEIDLELRQKNRIESTTGWGTLTA